MRQREYCFTMSLTEGERAALEQAAHRDDRSMAAVARCALRKVVPGFASPPIQQVQAPKRPNIQQGIDKMYGSTIRG